MYKPFSGSYAYFEASGIHPGMEAQLYSPVLIGNYLDTHRCLTFEYCAFGAHVGSLSVQVAGRFNLWTATNGRMKIVGSIFYVSSPILMYRKIPNVNTL